MKLTFENWLRGQKDRDDPIGDLANDYISTKYRGKIENSPFLDSACTDAVKAYKEAKREFKKLIKNIES